MPAINPVEPEARFRQFRHAFAIAYLWFAGGARGKPVYVATESNTIYAIDASSGEILLSPNLGSPVPTPLAIGLPAELPRRRPDIRSAELNAAAEAARIGVAEADLYPRF